MVKGGPGQSQLHKVIYNRLLSKIYIVPADLSKGSIMIALLEGKPQQA